jgi:hypothetical protein
MNESEFQVSIVDLSQIRNASSSSTLVILRDYCKWCSAKGIEGAMVEVYDTSKLGLSKIKSEMVSNPKHMQRCMDAMFKPVSDETVDCIYRGYLWLAYMGLSEREAVNVKICEIDFTSMAIKTHNKEFEIYREAIPVLKVLTSATHFKQAAPHSKNPILVERQSDFLLASQNGLQVAENFRTVVSRKSASAIKAGLITTRLNRYSVWLSGIFYRMHELELAGFPVDFRKLVEDLADERVPRGYKLDSGRQSQKSKLRSIAATYRNDYNRWKLAFNL